MEERREKTAKNGELHTRTTQKFDSIFDDNLLLIATFEFIKDES